MHDLLGSGARGWIRAMDRFGYNFAVVEIRVELMLGDI
jgi:hypothetical protein